MGHRERFTCFVRSIFFIKTYKAWHFKETLGYLSEQGYLIVNYLITQIFYRNCGIVKSCTISEKPASIRQTQHLMCIKTLGEDKSKALYLDGMSRLARKCVLPIIFLICHFEFCLPSLFLWWIYIENDKSDLWIKSFQISFIYLYLFHQTSNKYWQSLFSRKMCWLSWTHIKLFPWLLKYVTLNINWIYNWFLLFLLLSLT